MLMTRCGAVVGLFVDIRRWLVVYLYAGSGSFGHMPYLDSHGELDINMR
jgi:E3 ubiquitin-protein ligase UBR1